jgi:hypothetical protein
LSIWVVLQSSSPSWIELIRHAFCFLCLISW